jgi:DNA (cytosine-5)-methyltransferase 1
MSEVKPLCIDLFCGLGGWAEGFLAEGYRVIGFDINPQPLYPAEFTLADVRVLARDVEEKHLSGWYGRLRDAVVIVASPPCDDFSRWDQPWPNVIKNRKQPDLSLWFSAHRIHEAMGTPMIVENVRGAQKFMGPARAHFGKQYLWGDVPALLPGINGLQNEGRQKQTLSSTQKAERAKIPFPLAQHIARVFKPQSANA